MKTFEVKRLEADGGGREMVLVPVGSGDNHKHAVINRDDFEELMRLGLSQSWNTIKGNYVLAVSSRSNGGHVGVARVLLDAGPGQSISYRDGNRLNLRRDNLELQNGGNAKRRDRDYLTPIERHRGRRELPYVS